MATKKLDFSPLQEAIDWDGFDYLQTHAPIYLQQIERMVNQGATVEAIRGYLRAEIGPGRQEFIKRCEHAARWLARGK